MLLLSDEGWLTGIASITVVVIYYYFGLLFMYKSKKYNAKRLFQLSIMILLTGSFYIRRSIEFFNVILTGRNPYFSPSLEFILGLIWAPLSGAVSLVISTSLLIPKKKNYILIVFLCLLVTLFTVWILDPVNNVKIEYPTIPGEELTDINIVIGSPSGNLIILMMLFPLSFGGVGTLIKGIQSEGIIRRKFLFISIAWWLATIVVVLEAFTFSILTILYKIGLLISLGLNYYGLKEAPERLEERPTEKEILIKDGLFRIRKRPDHITEEEVSISKEKKICLICKGKLSGYNIFVCPYCDAFYCENCARALESLENACWVCNEPIDKAKPVRLGESHEEQIVADSLEKSKK
ncbi:MAG: hypothetical protein ACXAAI_14915 [Promethearchaeota archaeon]|jgi:hypothetical protein